MIYMVEMALDQPQMRAEWDAWYLQHMKVLLSIPGIEASQRFESLSPHPSPFVAIHQVSGPQVFASAPYRAKAGPGGTGEWRNRMSHWHRNLFTGLDATPEVPPAGALVVVEEGAEAPLPLLWLDAAGLDRSVERRAIAVLARREEAERLKGRPGVRVLKPLTARLVAPA